jgi:hypothetical protein
MSGIDPFLSRQRTLPFICSCSWIILESAAACGRGFIKEYLLEPQICYLSPRKLDEYLFTARSPKYNDIGILGVVGAVVACLRVTCPVYMSAFDAKPFGHHGSERLVRSAEWYELITARLRADRLHAKTSTVAPNLVR